MRKPKPKKLTLRLPEDLKKQIESAALADDRSLNEEIVHILRSYFLRRKARREKTTT